MSVAKITPQPRPPRQSGFTLIEMMIALAILLAVSAIVLSMTYEMTMRQASVANRSEMHGSVRGVTEVLQQEISQAGRFAFPTEFTTLATGIDVPQPDGGYATVSLANPNFIFSDGDPDGDGIEVLTALLVGVGDSQEIVRVERNPLGGGYRAFFIYDHPAGTQVRILGSFAEGILPTSDGTTLRIFGDINDNGNMVYIEYVCNPDEAGGTLTRQEMPWTTPVANRGDFPPQVLLNNVLPNPPLPDGTDVPCFLYQRKPVPISVAGVPQPPLQAVLNVGVTLTVRAEFNDLQTGQEQRQTKALLNVSPRNVYQAWQLAGMGQNRVQPTPASVAALAE